MPPASGEKFESPLFRWIPVLAVVWLIAYWFLFFTTRLPNASTAEYPLYRSDVLFLLPEIYAGLSGESSSPDSGWRFLPQRFGISALAALIIATAFATGRIALTSLKLDRQLDHITSWALAAGLGLSLISLLTLAAGLAGCLSQSLFITAMIVLGSASFAVRKPVEEQKRESTRPARWLPIACLAIVIPFLCCMWLGALLPQTDFDVKEYHLGGPKEYFLAGRIHFLSHDVYTSFPFLTEMLLLAGMAIRNDWEQGALVGQAVLVAFAPITALGVAGVTRRIAGDAAGWLAAAIYLTIPWTYRISIIAYTEGALCAYVVLPLLAFMVWREQRGNANAGWAKWGPLLVGMLAGSAVSTKYPGMLLVAIPFGVVTLISEWQATSHDIRRTLIAAGLYTAGILITFGPWMLKNFVETGNPVYPLLYSVFGGIDWNAELQAKWKNAHPPMLFQPGWNDVRGVLFANDWQSPLLFGLAPLALLDRKRGLLQVAAYAAWLFATWYLFTHRIDRFWVPLNPIMCVLAGCGLIAILRFDWPTSFVAVSDKKLKGKKLVPARLPADILFRNAAVLSLVSLATIYNFGFITTAKCGFNGYLMNYAAAWKQTQTRSVEIVDALKLPESSKVLFVGEAELFNARFPYAYCTVFDQNLLEIWTADKTGPDSWTMKSTADILQQLHDEGITHVFVNWNEILRYRTTYRFTDFVTPERLQELVAMEVLSPETLPQSMAYREWEGMDASWQQEVERWAPVLKTDIRGKPAMLQYEMFTVNGPQVPPAQKKAAPDMDAAR